MLSIVSPVITQYHTLIPMYYRDAAAAVIVYDITKAGTFNAVKAWVKELRTMGPADTVIAIAGNKSDLADEREVDMDEAKAYADEIGALYIETSAKSADNVQEMFREIPKMLPQDRQAAKGGVAELELIQPGTAGGGCEC